VAVIFVVVVNSLEVSFHVNDYTEEKEAGIFEKKEGIQKVFLQLGLPMFFYISGVATSFFDAQEEGFVKFFMNKCKRLLLSLLFAIFIFLMPRLYFAQKFEPFSRINGVEEEWNFFKFVWKTCPDILQKMSWLWFLLCLWVVSMISYPILWWTVRRSKGYEFERAEDLKVMIL